MNKKRLLIFIVSYNAEKFIKSVLDRIPENIWANDLFDVEVLIIDDQSSDQTFYRAHEYVQQTGKSNITILFNPINQGYGGNQKIGYHYAIEKKFDLVVLLHGDGQYAPEYLEKMVMPILQGDADVVLGSRMINKGAALRGRMPLYKWVGNIILTFIQNKILSTNLAEFHTGYRCYSVSALSSIPFEENSNYFDFDTDIIIQLLDNKKRIVEIPIPTYYGDEISSVNGLMYGARIIKTSILSRIMRLGIFYNPRFDYGTTNTFYTLKLGYESSHQFVLDQIPTGSSVLDIGSGPGLMAQQLSMKQVSTVSIDQFITLTAKQYSTQAIEVDLDNYNFDTVPEAVDYILLLDAIEHFRSPEKVLKSIRQKYSRNSPRIILTTGNIAFLPIRLALLIGQFNYGKRGILDLSHTRLFTFYSLRNILQNCGYDILYMKGLPAPFPLALGSNNSSRILLCINQMLIKISKGLFSYQIVVVAKPRPTLESLLENAVNTGRMKLKKVEKFPVELQ